MKSDSKVHLDTEVTRYRQDGSVLGRFNSLYILTKRRWPLGHQDAQQRRDADQVIADPRVVSFVVVFAALGR
jgi:hypothetical protein